MNEEKLNAIQLDGITALLTPPVSFEAMHGLCEMAEHLPIIKVGYGDLSRGGFTDAYGIGALACLKPSDPKITQAILPSLKNPDSTVRWNAAYALADLPVSKEDIPKLITALHDPVAKVARGAAWSLSIHKPTDPEAQSEIAKSIQNTDYIVASKIIETMVAIKPVDRGVLNIMVDALRTNDVGTRKKLLWALKEINPQDLEIKKRIQMESP
jgi:hypothetical protein